MGDDLLEKETNGDAQLKAGSGKDSSGFVLQLGLQTQAHISGLRYCIGCGHGCPPWTYAVG